MSVRVGVIGAGVMGADHARTLERYVARASVTMVADVDHERTSALKAEIPTLRATVEPLEVINSPDVEAVLVASPDSTHAELTLAALKLGKPVMCEKPLASSLSECLDIVQAEARATEGRSAYPLVSVGFMRRFDRSFGDMRSRIGAGEIGVPLLAHCVSRGVRSAPGATSELSITGSAVHEFDIVPWLLGSPVSEVSWHAPRHNDVQEGLKDPQLMLLHTEDGALVTLEIYLNAGYGYDIRCEVVGEEGGLELGNGATTTSNKDGRRSAAYANDWRERFADAYRRELQAWVDSIVDGVPSSLATSRDGLVAAAVSDAAISSMNLGGQPVRVTVPA